MHERYLEQVRLLVELIPRIAVEDVFALKGGTAINLFYRPMPRLSVDLDLVYLPLDDRQTALQRIDEAFERIMVNLAKLPQYHVTRSTTEGQGSWRMIVQRGRSRVKVELSPVLRGTVLPPQTMSLADEVTSQFGFAEMRVASFQDVFAGKMVAAFDRTHPRDLFDIKGLLETEGISDLQFRVFLIYLASSPRPLHELLDPQKGLDDDLFINEFQGMTQQSVLIDDLRSTFSTLVSEIRGRLTGTGARFLETLHEGAPDFHLIGFPNAGQLPAVRWKVLNLERLKSTDPKKHRQQSSALGDLLRG